MKQNLKIPIQNFIKAFEDVFDKDWEYSKEMMGIHGQSEDQKMLDKKLGLEIIDIISEEGTFLNPMVDDEIEDWGNRGSLLQQYRILKKILKEID